MNFVRSSPAGFAAGRGRTPEPTILGVLPHRFYEEMQGVHPTILNSEARIPDLVNVGKHDRRQLIESDLAGSRRNWSNRGRTGHFV